MDTGDARSVYQRALPAERFAALDPGLRAYFGPVPAGRVGVGHGVFAFAGPTVRRLGPVLRLLAWRRILFPERGRDIPFTVRNEARPDGALVATRTFAFPRRPRTMLDRMTVGAGGIVDRLGRRGGLEVTLCVAVVDAGLRLTSRRLAWRVGRLRVPLPPLARVVVDERMVAGRQRVDARVQVTGLGEVFRYTGTFAYRIVAGAGASASA